MFQNIRIHKYLDPESIRNKRDRGFCNSKAVNYYIDIFHSYLIFFTDLIFFKIAPPTITYTI